MVVDLDHRVKVILALCQKANETSLKWNSEERKQAHRAFWDAVMELDKEAGEGLQAGRLLQIPCENNYARYIITRVGKKTCKVIHLNYMAGRQSPVVSDNEIWTGEAEGRIMFEDTIRAAFAKQHPLKVVAAEPIAA